jgi:predicted dehydrogenase
MGKQRASALISAGIEPNLITVVDPFMHDQNSVHPEMQLVEDFSQLSLDSFSYAVVSVPHSSSVEISHQLLNQGVQVLMEKPMGRNLEESRLLIQNSFSNNLSVGFNYRFMPGVKKLRTIIQSQELGDIYTIKVDLGHGGKPEDMNSWKLNSIKAGGGVLLDPGIHVIDLLNYIFPISQFEYKIEKTVVSSGFWKTGIEESAYVIGSVGKSLLNLSFSIVAWKTRFNLEVVGSDGYALLQGRGRTDGPQILVTGPRWGWRTHKNQASSETVHVKSIHDNSILHETSGWLKGDKDVAKATDGLISEEIRSQIVSAIT